MTPDLDAALGPVVGALDALAVPYYLAGSVVSSLHGIARATADVDIVASLERRHVGAFVATLEPSYYIDADAVRDAVGRGSMFNVVHLPTMLKVDVYACTTDFDRSALARRWRDVMLSDPAPRGFAVATPEDVILHKLHWYRIGGGTSDRQWGDILGVVRMQRAIDREFLRSWAERLDVSDLLERALVEADG